MLLENTYFAVNTRSNKCVFIFRQYKYAGHRGKAEKFLEGKLFRQGAGGLGCIACGIPVPQPGFKSELPAVEAWSPNYWTARAVPWRWNFIDYAEFLPLFSFHSNFFLFSLKKIFFLMLLHGTYFGKMPQVLSGMKQGINQQPTNK